jgi:hypothetical protein
MFALHHIEIGTGWRLEGLRPSSALVRFATPKHQLTCNDENGYVAGGLGP